MSIDTKEDEEARAVEELRRKMKDKMDADLYEDTHLFMRFLKAQNFNMVKAEDMLKKHLAWREKYDVKNALKYEKTEVMKKYVSNVILGYDKEGCLVRYSPAGNLDYIGLVSSCTFDEIIKLAIYEIETDTLELKKQSEKLGKNIEQCVYIYNFQNLSFANSTDKRVLYAAIILAKFYVDNYPGRLKAAYFYNVSVYFHMAYSVLKTLLPKSIEEKIHLYSDDSYKEDLLKIIDEDVLPAFLGGNRTDPDGNPLCLTFINPGGPIPHCYYLENHKKALADSPDVMKITLSSAAFHEINLEIEEEGSYLEWEFETKSKDIGFGLFYSEVNDGKETITQLIPIQRIDTEAYPETGTFRCERPGKYVIVFDNTYSLVRAKEIYYRSKILTPKEHELQVMKE